MNDNYFEILMKLAIKASKKGEIPVSALIVKNNKVIAKAYNKRENKKFVENHAEIIAIKKASKKLKDWRLFNCDLYVTLEPCAMCEQVINQSRVENVYYLLEKNIEKKEYYKTKYVKTNNSTQVGVYSTELRTFFQKKRDKKKVI